MHVACSRVSATRILIRAPFARQIFKHRANSPCSNRAIFFPLRERRAFQRAQGVQGHIDENGRFHQAEWDWIAPPQGGETTKRTGSRVCADDTRDIVFFVSSCGQERVLFFPFNPPLFSFTKSKMNARRYDARARVALANYNFASSTIISARIYTRRCAFADCLINHRVYGSLKRINRLRVEEK